MGCLTLSRGCKLADVVEGNPDVPFSIATAPRCKGGRYSFFWITLLTFDPNLTMLSKEVSSTIVFLYFFGMTRPGIEPRPPEPLANTLTFMPIGAVGILIPIDWVNKTWFGWFGWLVGLVLWRINLCRLFNAKFCLYIDTFNQRFLN